MQDDYEAAQKAIDDWLKDVPTIFTKEEGMFVHAGVIVGIIQEVIASQDALISSGEVDENHPFLAGQASVANMFYMVLETFTKRHVDDLAEFEVRHTDFEAAMKAMTTLEQFKDLLDKGDKD